MFAGLLWSHNPLLYLEGDCFAEFSIEHLNPIPQIKKRLRFPSSHPYSVKGGGVRA